MLLTAIAAIAMSQAPAPQIAVPSPRQLAWQKLEYYGFVHFGPNTFTDQEWGHGTEDPEVFNPTALDCRQWVRTFKEAGMKQVIITAKHHDGFCLWPSKFSKHTVAQSKWRDGKGDVLAELRKACDEYGLKMGVYLSPWDRNHPKYGTPEYNQVFADMLKEVLTKYGPFYEVWFDGANGEGPNGKKQVYDWDLFNSTVRKYAPDAVIFSDAGPDIRWVGNEEGWAPETSWSTVPSGRYVPGTPYYKELGEGNPKGDLWVPSECDVSIRPGWFYHANQDDKVKTPAQLMDLYERSVGRNSSFLLNVPPDRRGLIHENDVKALMEFKALRDQTYARTATNSYKLFQVDTTPVTEGAQGELARPIGASKDFDGQEVLKLELWPSDSFGAVRLLLDKPTVIDRIELSESLVKGQSVTSFNVQVLGTGNQSRFVHGKTVGAKRIIPIEPIEATLVQIEISGVKAPLALRVPKVYASPAAKLQADKDKRMAWFREAKFGMFIHWGLYAVPAGVWNGKNVPSAAEWLQFTAQVPVKDYEPLIKQFNPVKYDAKEWVRIAKDAGMKYIVITSKHHEGFGLWDSKQTDWDIASTPYKKDLLKQLAKACKEAGIKLCFYHSIMDWHHPDYLPRRPWDPRPDVKANFPKYVDFMKKQLKELLTDYGDIGILWFDGEWESTWTHEMGKDLYTYIRKLQPNIIVNNRVDKGRAGMQGMTQGDHFMGDYGTPEQEIPANGFPGIDWESCMTMNDTWGFSSHDHNWKSPAKLVQNLIDCVSKGGNYLLNVGPTAEGLIPQPSVERLAAVGKWLRANGDSIYGAMASPFPKQLPWGRVTQKPGAVYLHVFRAGAQEVIELPGFSANIKQISCAGRLVGSHRKGDSLFVTLPKLEGPPDDLPMVIRMDIEGKPTIVSVLTKQNPDRSLELNAADAKIIGQAAYEADKNCIGFWTSQNDTVEWEFDAIRGEVDVEMELACADDSAGSTFEVQVSGQTLKGVVPKTGGFEKFVKIKLGRASIVVPGKTKLIVKPLSKPGLAVMNLRAIRFKPL